MAEDTPDSRPEADDERAAESHAVDSASDAPASVGRSGDDAAAPPAGPGRRTEQLYRAAIGPVGAERYLAVFDRFDTLGRRPLVWHAPAGLWTLGWLLFRRLWREAAVYALAAGATAALLTAQWPLVSSWPAGVQAGLFATVALLAVLLPGLTGHALMHRHVQQRVLQVAGRVKSMDEACAALSLHAPTPQRLRWLVGAQAVLLLGLWLFWTAGPAPGRNEVEPAASRAEPVAPPASVPASASVARVDGAAVTAGAEASSPSNTAAATVSGAEPAVASATTRATASASLPAESSATVTATLPEARSGTATVVSVGTVADAPASAATTAKEPAQAAAPYAINVGLFADKANAQRVRDRLNAAGLPVTVERVAFPRGERSRVRVGPFVSRAEADAAAVRIRALGLDAVVFRR